MSSSSKLSHLSTVVGKRDTSLGLNLSSAQAINLPANTKSEILIIPSTSAPAFGSYFVLDFREKNCMVNEFVINYNATAITGRSGDATNYPRFSPASFWASRIEVVINGTVVDTIYNTQQFVMKQLSQENEDRILTNSGEGNYASGAQRRTLASTASQNYYVKLKTLFDAINYPVFAEQHAIQLRVYMDSLANVVALSGGTGTAVATLNSCNLIAKITRLSSEMVANRSALMTRTPEHSIFHQLRYGTFTVNSGVSSTSIVLTPIVGNVAFIFFVVRTATAMTMDSAFVFNAIKNFAIIDNGGANCVGGQAIPSALCLQYLMRNWSRSSYTAETSVGSNIDGSVSDNGANVYGWSFSSAPCEALDSGVLLGSRRFQGSEQLQIEFPSSLGAGVQVDVFAYCEAVLEQGSNLVKVHAL
jgi:hypothetical protein